jgi:pimeloyl-ACP methyl ester carboxylesterase
MRDEHPLPGTDQVVDGVRVHVVRHGAGPGLPLLLLHGFPTSSYLWRDVQRDLEHQHVTYAPDLLGLGASERPAAARYDLASQAALMLALLGSLGLDRVGIVAHDIGAGVAVHLAALAPERVAALVLVNPPLHADAWPVPDVSSLGVPLLGPGQLLALRAGGPAGRRYLTWKLSRGLQGPALTPRKLDHYVGPLLTTEGAAGVVRLVRALDPKAVESALQLIRLEPPATLVLWGEGDPYHSTAYGRRVASDIVGSTFVPVPDAGHFLPEDRPERVAEEVAAFVAELPARVAAG